MFHDTYPPHIPSSQGFAPPPPPPALVLRINCRDISAPDRKITLKSCIPMTAFPTKKPALPLFTNLRHIPSAQGFAPPPPPPPLVQMPTVQ